MTRVARPDEVDYALAQNMGEGFQRGRVQLKALGAQFDMVYAEWLPTEKGSEADLPVVVCIHGTPATEGAFRPIGSRIAARGFRVLAVNMPGMGLTEVDPDGRYDFTAAHKAELVKAFITQMQLARVEALIGHSTGGQVVGHLCADQELRDVVKSACFLCSTGAQPYSSQRYTTLVPYLPYLLYRSMSVPIVGPVFKFLLSRLVHSLGFRAKTPEAQVVSIYEGYQIDFDLFARNLGEMGSRQLPVLVLYTLDDTVVEAESLPEVIDLLGIPDSDIKEYSADGQVQNEFQDGTKRRVVRFATGTHRLQFKKPEETVHEITSFLEAIK